MSALKAARIPIAFLALYGLVDVIGQLGYVPTVDNVARSLEGLFTTYGAVAVAGISVLENLVLINAYFPGSLVILTAMAMQAGNPEAAAITFCAIYGGATIGYHLSFLVGRMSDGLWKKRSQSTYNSTGLGLLFLATYWHPHLAAVTNTAVGGSPVPYSRFLLYSLLASLPWNLFWGGLMYSAGTLIKGEVDLSTVLYVYLVGWIVYEVLRSRPRNRQ